MKSSSDYIATKIYECFLNLSDWKKRPVLSKIWEILWRFNLLILKDKSVRTQIHNHPAILNYGATYPVYSRIYPGLNNPFLELVYQSYRVKQSPIVLLDIGASIGDTVMLAHANCPGMIGQTICIEADDKFFNYLSRNLSQFQGIQLYKKMLSNRETQERSLKYIHPGTASAQGKDLVDAQTLDSLLLDADCKPIDVIKIDVDGFDGKVIDGSQKLLLRDQPAVIFEWYPQVYKDTQNDFYLPFDVLQNAGYDRFYWFNKYGDYVKKRGQINHIEIEKEAQHILLGPKGDENYYDIIALPKKSQIEEQSITSMNFAKSKKSPY